MGLSYNTYLNSAKIYGCKACKAHLANHDDIISRVRGKQHLGCNRWHSTGLPHPGVTICIPLTTDDIQQASCSPPPLNPLAELPWPAWQSLPIPQRRQHRNGRAERAEYDYRKACGLRHYLSPVQRNSRLEI